MQLFMRVVVCVVCACVCACVRALCVCEKNSLKRDNKAQPCKQTKEAATMTKVRIPGLAACRASSSTAGYPIDAGRTRSAQTRSAVSSWTHLRRVRRCGLPSRTLGTTTGESSDDTTMQSIAVTKHKHTCQTSSQVPCRTSAVSHTKQTQPSMAQDAESTGRRQLSPHTRNHP